MRRQSGFAAVETVVLVVILIAIAATGYLVVHNGVTVTPQLPSSSKKVLSPNVSSVNTASSTSAPATPEVNSSSDLISAYQSLNTVSDTSNTADNSVLTYQAAGL